MNATSNKLLWYVKAVEECRAVRFVQRSSYKMFVPNMHEVYLEWFIWNDNAVYIILQLYANLIETWVIRVLNKNKTVRFPGKRNDVIQCKRNLYALVSPCIGMKVHWLEISL